MMLNTGLLSLGVAGFWGIGAYISTVLVMEMGISFWYALFIAGFISGLVAILFGLIMVRMAGMVFAILTMVVNMIVIQIVANVPIFGGWGGILGIPKPDPIVLPLLPPIQFNAKPPFYYLIIGLLLITIVIFYGLYNSRVGRNWKAIKQTPHLAESVGINLFKYRLMAFVIASVFAGLAGSFYAHYFQTIEPESFNVFKSIYIQLYAVLGGVDYLILGPLVGAITWTLIPAFLSQFKEYIPLVTGLVLILLVIYFRGGLLSLPAQVSKWSRKNSAYKAFIKSVFKKL
jgi:branched-chain amino acid transport system permease protein